MSGITGSISLAATRPRPAEYLTKKSQNLYLIALRALLRYLAERDIETLPSTKIKLAKQKAEEPDCLSGAPGG